MTNPEQMSETLRAALALPTSEQNRLLKWPIANQRVLTSDERRMKAALVRYQGIVRKQQQQGPAGASVPPQSSASSPLPVSEAPDAARGEPADREAKEPKERSLRTQNAVWGREMAPTLETAIKAAALAYVMSNARDLLTAGVHPDQLAQFAIPPQIAAQMAEPAGRLLARTPIGKKYHEQIGGGDDLARLVAGLIAWNIGMKQQLELARQQLGLPTLAQQQQFQAPPQAARTGPGRLAQLLASFRVVLNRGSGSAAGPAATASQSGQPGAVPDGVAASNGHATTDAGGILINGQAYQPAEW